MGRNGLTAGFGLQLLLSPVIVRAGNNLVIHTDGDVFHYFPLSGRRLGRSSLVVCLAQGGNSAKTRTEDQDRGGLLKLGKRHLHGHLMLLLAKEHLTSSGDRR